MNLKEKWSKQNNSVKLLLKKLKRHDTVVVAIAVVIATALCGGLIYLSTPVVTANAKQELQQDEMANNEKTVERLDELKEYLDGIDKTVAENQKSLSSYHEKNTENNKEANEKAAGLNNDMRELRQLISNTENTISTIRQSVESGDAESGKKLEESFKNLNIELENIENKYNTTQENTKNLMSELDATISNKMGIVNNNIVDLKSYIGSENADIASKLDAVFTLVSNGKELLASTLLTYEITVNKDAKFQEIADAIARLGNQRNAAAAAIGIMNNADNITSDKVMAGSSVTKSIVTFENESFTTQEIVIEGTATADANAVADNLSAGKTAYVNGQLVTGTGKDAEDAFNTGYASGYVDGTNAAMSNVSVTYTIGHKHTGDVTHNGGCYTVEASRGIIGYESHDCRPADHYSGDAGYYQCVKCGYGFYPAFNPEVNPSTGSGNCRPIYQIYYTTGCGMEEGAFLRESDSNECGENEKVISATVNINY